MIHGAMKMPKKTIAIAVAATAACAALFAAYAFLPLTAPPRYNSPDETANAFFSRQFALHGSLWYVEPFNLVAEGAVHPRSVRVVQNFLVPGGFLGLPVIYGAIAKAIGTGAIPFLTPLFAVAAVIAWGILIAKRFGSRAGLAAGVLLAIQPAWWYASSRTLQPNILFASMVILSACAFFVAPVRSALDRRGLEGLRLLRLTDAAVAGILMGAAVAVRMAEAYWLGLGALALLIVCRKRVRWAAVIAFAVTAAFTIAPLLIVNQAVYGHPLATGYGLGVSVPAGELPHGRADALLGPLRPLLFPLGFAPRTALANFWTYGVAFFWWWSILTCCGVVAAVAMRRRRGLLWRENAGAFAVVAAVIAIWLILFYGSWTVQDNPDPDAVTIGSSYLRYWLPLSVLSTVPVAWLVTEATERIGKRFAALAIAAVLALAVAASASDVYWAAGEGLVAVRGNLVKYDRIVKEIVAKTGDHSLVVADREDKYVFPDRPVITPLRAESTYAALGKLKKYAHLWYFGITLPAADLEYLRKEKLPPLGLSIEPVEAFGDETLYRLPAAGEGQTR